MTHDPGIVTFDCQDLSLLSAAPSRRNSIGINEHLHVGFGLTKELSTIEGFDLRNDGFAFFNFIRQTMQQSGSLVRGHFRPLAFLKSLNCRVHSPVNIMGLERGDGCKLASISRIERLERLTALGFDLFATDKSTESITPKNAQLPEVTHAAMWSPYMSPLSKNELIG